VVIFACERIPAMGTPAATVDLLHKNRGKAAGAHEQHLHGRTAFATLIFKYVTEFNTPFHAVSRNFLSIQQNHQQASPIS
jgi:hypothetical protein